VSVLLIIITIFLEPFNDSGVQILSAAQHKGILNLQCF
jgi:hypothetical protein